MTSTKEFKIGDRVKWTEQGLSQYGTVASIKHIDEGSRLLFVNNDELVEYPILTNDIELVGRCAFCGLTKDVCDCPYDVGTL